MASNPYVNKVVFGASTIIDISDTTATADKILQGYGAYGADGGWIDGTASPPEYVSVRSEGKVQIKDSDGVELFESQSQVNGIVSFKPALGVELEKIQIYVEPSQNLNGYDNSWAAGAGKSKVPVSMYSNNYTNYGINITVNDDGTITTTGSNTGTGTLSIPGNSIFSASNIAAKLVDGQTYFLSGCPAGGSSSTYRLTLRTITNGTNTYATDTGSGISFTYDAASDYTGYININKNVNVDGFVWKPMICLDSESDKTWEPYANVCPITGFTGANIYKTGDNLCRVARAWSSHNGIEYTENDDGTVHAEGTATAESLSAGSITSSVSNIDSRCVYIVPTGTYTISNIAGVRIWVQFRNADNTDKTKPNTTIEVGASGTFTFTEPTIIYIRADILNGESVDTDMQVMVTYGETAATVYKPWQMQTVATDWTSSAGTVYGGIFDALAGTLSVTNAFVEFDGVTDGKKMDNTESLSGYNSYYSVFSGGKVYGTNAWVSKADAESDHACCSVAKYRDETTGINYGFRNGTSGDFQIRFNFPTSANISTLEAANQWLNDLYTAGTPCTVCYPLETPLTYQLTAQSITMLTGYNNVWTDPGREVDVLLHL